MEVSKSSPEIRGRDKRGAADINSNANALIYGISLNYTGMRRTRVKKYRKQETVCWRNLRVFIRILIPDCIFLRSFSRGGNVFFFVCECATVCVHVLLILMSAVFARYICVQVHLVFTKQDDSTLTVRAIPTTTPGREDVAVGKASSVTLCFL